MSEATALKIALEALLELRAHGYSHENDAIKMRTIALKAIRDVQLENLTGRRVWPDGPSRLIQQLLPGIQSL